MRKTNSNVFRNAVIDAENLTITETNKDEQYVFDLQKVLSDWSGIDGVSLTIKKDSVITD